MFRLTIPKPCHADWNDMLPTQQGAFCSSCSKEVVDFTQMSDEEVKNYFLQKQTGSTCGRFHTRQIQRIRISLSDTIFIQKIAGWKKYMAIVLLAFGSMLFGCDVDVNKHTQGMIEIQKHPNPKLLGDTSVVDTTAMLGKIRMPMGTSVVVEKDKKTCQVITGAVVAPPVMGEIAVLPDTINKPLIDTAAVGTKMGDAAVPLVEKKLPVSYTSTCKDSSYF